MAGFDELIRKAIANHAQAHGGPAGKQEREAIYASSHAALERMLAQNPVQDEAAMQAQRNRLNAAIATVEADFATQAEPTSGGMAAARPDGATQAVPSAPPHPMPPSMSRPERLEPEMPSVEHDGTVHGVGPAPAVPPVSAGGGLSAARDPATGSAGEQPFSAAPYTDRPPHARGEPVPDYDGHTPRKRKPYAKMLAWVIILTGLGVAMWWLYTFGTGLLNPQQDGSVPNPQQVTELGPFQPESNRAEGDGPWMTVFDPARDVSDIITGQRGTAELVEMDGRRFALITSSDNTDNGRILIRIPRNIVEEIAGKVATFEILARGTDSDGQQVGIFCEFDALGSCGRSRFEADTGQVSHVFDVLTEDAALPAGHEAYLAFSTDLTDGGRGLAIAGIRVRTGS